MLAVQGPRAREFVQALADAPLPPRMTAATRRLAGVRDARVRHRLHRRGRRRAAAAPADAPALWDELARRGASPRGWPRATRCAWRPATTCTATTCPPSAGRSRPGWAGAAPRTPTSSGPRPCARCALRTQRKARRVRDRGPGIARQGNPIAGGGVVTSGTLSPCLGIGIGLAYVPAERAAVGARLEIDVRGKMRPAVVREKPLNRKGA